MLRLKLANRAANRPESHSFRAGFRGLLGCLAVSVGLLLVAPATGLANPITDENDLPGTSGWEVPQADPPKIEGYTDKTSIAPGESLTFHVSTNPSASYRIRIFRLGWYGGAGARLIGCLGSTFQAAPTCTTTSSGSARTTPNPNAQTGEIDASNNPAGGSWPETNTLSAANTANWTTGEYVAEYTLGSAPNFTARYSPFVVRSSAPQSSASSILVVVPYNTYLAYNKWGGTSAYENTTSGSFHLAHATKVSFNRPFDRKHWSYWDLPLLHFLEREGYDVSYVSDTDVDANPNILLNHRAVIVSGHSEYWTKNMRDGFDAARDQGTNLLFAGANDAYWQVRYEDSSCADDNTVCGTIGDRRTMVIYKQETGDPTDPISNSSLKTIKWRDLGRPECELQGGVQYGSWFPNDGYADYTTTAAGAADPWADGSGLSSGTTIKGLVGFEFDSFLPDCDVPGTPTILFSYQSAFTSADIDAAAVRYTANGSGARVFSSGSEQWAWGLDSYRWDPSLFTGIPAQNTAIQQLTRNMLTDMQKPASPVSLTATRSGNSIQIETTPQTDPRITSYKVYRHAGTGTFQPDDPGVTQVCQNASGDCTDTPPAGTYRYASVAVDQWNDSAAALSGTVDNLTPPTAVNDSGTVSEDASGAPVPVTSNDTNPSGNPPITIGSVTQPTNGTVAITGGGTGLTYQPNANYCNSPPGTSLDTFTYTINGGSTATVSINVTCVDDAPVAIHDGKSVVEDDPATALNVTANDTDIDGGTKEVISFTQPAHGTVTGAGTADHWTDVKYTPSANYCNFVNGQGSIGPTDDFTYTLNGGSSTTVTMTVDCRDDPAIASDDSATVIEDAAATAIPVLSNDTDAEGDPVTISSSTQPAHGAVVLTGGVAGARTGLTYQPSPNYCGSDSFTYTVNEGDTATVSMTVTCVDDPPDAVHDGRSMVEDDPATSLNPLANDTDVDGGPKEIAYFTQPSHGTVTGVGTAGHWTDLKYQPNANYCNYVNGHPELSGPSDDFTYTLNLGSTTTVSLTVDCRDDPADAVNDSATINEDAAATTIPVLSNDTDVEGDAINIVSKTDPAHGTVAITGGGTGLTYKPNADYCNTQTGGSPDTFTYTVNGSSPNKTATVSMTVTCVDDPPVAKDDSGTVSEDAAATPVSVLANDTDVDGDPITIVSKANPANGTVAITGGGTGLTYKPNADYCNTQTGSSPDTFTYTVNGGDTATVTVTVTCVDDSPVAKDDSPSVNEDSSSDSINVLANDTDIDGGPKSIASFTNPSHGTVSGTGGAPNAWTGLSYTPDPDYCNIGSPTDDFEYTLNGGDTATVSVTVACEDDSPVAKVDSATVAEDASATAVPVLSNDTDTDGGSKTIDSVDTTGTHGTVVVNGDGSGLTYQPDHNYCNTPGDPADIFTYTLNGGSTATVSMTVNCVDDPPDAADDSATVTEDASASGINVLGNDSDPEGDAITIESKTDPANGIVQITGGGTGLTYQPNPNYCGSDSFTYTVNGDSPNKTATVSTTVDCVDDPPDAGNDAATVTEDASATSIPVLFNDTDVEGNAITIESNTDPAHGTVEITDGGTGLTYKPDANYCNKPPGTSLDTFTYTVNGDSPNKTATVSVTVDCVDDLPTAVDDSATALRDSSATPIPVLSNDIDPEGDPRTISSVTQPLNGKVVLTGGTAGARTGLTYAPVPGYCNTPAGPTDDFTYIINGGSFAIVAMTVICPSASPTPIPPQQTVTTPPKTKKCKKGFKKVKGKCKKKKKKKKRKRK